MPKDRSSHGDRGIMPLKQGPRSCRQKLTSLESMLRSCQHSRMTTRGCRRTMRRATGRCGNCRMRRRHLGQHSRRRLRSSKLLGKTPPVKVKKVACSNRSGSCFGSTLQPVKRTLFWTDAQSDCSAYIAKNGGRFRDFVSNTHVTLKMNFSDAIFSTS